jgi:ribulose-5-phosphate 4-epimerase/fuculose-1-phosphate aldolase
MRTHSDLAGIHHLFKTVGSALMRVNFNNTHSGNMSCRDPLDARRFWITASGSPCGDLSPADLVSVRFDDLHCTGPARPSSEANTHRRVLELSDASACVHCHTIASTLLSLETRQQPIFLSESSPPAEHPEEYLFQPLDVWGASLIGPVPVGVFRHTVGSPEMERRIPAYLCRAPVTIVKGHGPFARGQGLAQCLHYLSVLENSAATAIALRRRGIDTLALQQAIRSGGAPAIAAWTPRRMEDWEQPSEPAVEAEHREDFVSWLAYSFDRGLGAYGTGSMSRRLSADEMIFCPMSAAPLGVGVPLLRTSLHPRGPEAADVRLHRLIYARTPFKACMLAFSPMAAAEASAALVAANGIEALAGAPRTIERSAAECPIVAPIDAESAYHKIRLPVASLPALALDSEGELVSSLLQTGSGCGLIAGCGVIAAGEHSLAQAAYRVSLAERAARFRLEVDLNHRLLAGPPVAAFE